MLSSDELADPVKGLGPFPATGMAIGSAGSGTAAALSVHTPRGQGCPHPQGRPRDPTWFHLLPFIGERWLQPTGGRQKEPSPNLKPR